MGEVELDRSAATRLKVDKQQPVLRAEHVARMRLAVQQLLGGAPLDDRAPQAPQRVAEKLPVRVSKLRCLGAVADQPLRFRDSIREVRRRQIDLAHAGMLPLERLRILGWRDVLRRHRLVVGPQRDREAVTHVDARLHPRFRLCHRAARFGESPSNLDFERSACLMREQAPPERERHTASGARRCGSSCEQRPRHRLSGQALSASTYPQPPHVERLMPSSSLSLARE